MKYFSLLITIALGLAMNFAGNMAIAGSTIYVYQSRDGSRLITDHPRVNANYRLLKAYRVGDEKLQPATYSPTAYHRAKKSKFSRYDGLISLTASRFGIDKALIKAIVEIESSYNPNAVSKKGAYGLMQLMPETAKRYGVRNVQSPTENLQGGVRYLKDLLQMFNQDTKLALAAYNAGENSVKRYNGVPPYRETIDYVKKVMQLYDNYRP
ncbi:lytic transglycosylase domain-containing protein [Pseudomonadota bacterium]